MPLNYFTQEQQAFQKTVRDFFEKEINPNLDEWEAAEIFPAHDVFKRCGELGMLGITYDEKYGGSGLDYWWTAAFSEAMAESCRCSGIPMAIMVQTDMCTPALHDVGSEELKEQWLAPSIRGEAVGAIGVTEPAAGSDVFGIQTVDLPLPFGFLGLDMPGEATLTGSYLLELGDFTAVLNLVGHETDRWATDMNPIPEPSSFALLAAGLTALAARRRATSRNAG